jgi:hypothetical protein
MACLSTVIARFPKLDHLENDHASDRSQTLLFPKQARQMLQSVVYANDFQTNVEKMEYGFSYAT